MATQLNDITVLVNNVPIAYTAGTLKWKDGFGEYSVRNAVVGGGQTEQIFSKDLASKFGMIEFSMPSIVENENYKRAWKLNDNNNVVELIGNGDNQFTKIFTQACILDDPETNTGADGDIVINFNSNPAQ